MTRFANSALASLAGIALLTAAIAGPPLPTATQMSGDAQESVAAAADVIFRGEFYFYDSSGTCPNYNPKGNIGTVRFLPRSLGANGTDSRFVFFAYDNAQSFYLPGDSFSATAKTVLYHTMWDAPGTPPTPATVAFTAQTPAVFAAGTKFIDVTGVIDNWDWMPGCVVNFRMALNLATN